MGTSGVFNVLDISPSINPVDIRGQKMPWSDILKPSPRDKVANLVGVALESIREQALAALHACRQIHGDRNLPEAERHRRAAKASAGLFVSAQSHVEKATAASAKAVEDLTKWWAPDKFVLAYYPTCAVSKFGRSWPVCHPRRGLPPSRARSIVATTPLLQLCSVPGRKDFYPRAFCPILN